MKLGTKRIEIVAFEMEAFQDRHENVYWESDLFDDIVWMVNIVKDIYSISYRVNNNNGPSGEHVK